MMICECAMRKNTCFVTLKSVSSASYKMSSNYLWLYLCESFCVKSPTFFQSFVSARLF